MKQVESEAEQAEEPYDDNDEEQQTGSNVAEHPMYGAFRRM